MLKNYIKIAIRNFRKNKSYVFINISGLSLSLACGIAIFSTISYHLSFDDFHPDSENIYRSVTEIHGDQIVYNSSVPNPFGLILRENYDYTEQVARIYTFQNEVITVPSEGNSSKFKENEIAFIEDNFFQIFNYPLLNDNKKAQLTSPNTAVITEKIAKKYFGDKNPINKIFTVGNRIDFKVVGVLEDIPSNTVIKTQVFLSYHSLKEYNDWYARDDDWGGISSTVQCFVELKDDVAPKQVEEALTLYGQKFNSGFNTVHKYKLQPLRDIHFNARYGGAIEKRTIWVLAVICLFLIVTACVNFINLATAQASERAKEVGIRKFLGSNKSQLFWQFMVETAFITIIAAVTALLIYKIAFPFIISEFNLGLNEMRLFGWDLMLFIFIVLILVIFLSGTYPGLILARFKPIASLRNSTSFRFGKGLNLRRALIITQFIISQALIIGLIIVLYQMQYLNNSDMGFDKEAMIIIPVGSNDQAMETLKNQFLEIPTVDEVSLCFSAPASQWSWNNNIRFANSLEEQAFSVNFKSADETYLSTFDLELVAGRNLQPSDTVREFVINETLVKKLNIESPEDIIGRSLIVGPNLGQVVGVIKDFHDRSFHEEIRPIAISTNVRAYRNYAVKTNLAVITSTLSDLDRLWSETYPEQIYEYAFLDEQIAAFYANEKSMLQLIQLFSFVAIFLGLMGLYGLVSFMARQKTKEIGIRKVLGGSVFQMLKIFGKEIITLVVIAFFIAAPLSWWMMSKWLQNFQYRIDIGIWIFILALTSTILISLITVGYQSLKAALMNPVDSLKNE